MHVHFVDGPYLTVLAEQDGVTITVYDGDSRASLTTTFAKFRELVQKLANIGSVSVERVQVVTLHNDEVKHFWEVW